VRLVELTTTPKRILLCVWIGVLGMSSIVQTRAPVSSSCVPPVALVLGHTGSRPGALSGTGRYVAFTSDSDDVVPG
jgi:hypothetical protein